MADQIAQFIVKASGQNTGSNLSAENEQNAGEVQDLSENELDQFSKVARHKYNSKKEFNRYKQQAPSTPKTPSKIEIAEDKSDTFNNPNEAMTQYKKTKDLRTNSSEGKKRKRKPKHVDMKEEKNEELQSKDETTIRQQKRWKKKESEDERQESQKKTLTKRQRLRKKKAKEPNFDDDDLSYYRNENKTMSNISTDLPSADVSNNEKKYDKHDMEKKINAKFTTRQKRNRYIKPHDYSSENDGEYKSRYRSRNDKHALLKAPEDTSMDAPMDSPMDASLLAAPNDTPILGSKEINFEGVKAGEPTEGNVVTEFTPKINAFKIAAGVPGLGHKLEDKRKDYLLATSGHMVLPRISVQEEAQSRRRRG